MLPIQAPQTLLNSLQNICSSFIWGNKKPRISCTILYKHPTKGGVGLPNLNQYYKATMLASGILLHLNRGIIQWVDMEKAQLDKNATLDYLWTPKKHRPVKPNLYPTTTLTVHIWSTFLDTVGAKEKFHPNAPLTALRAISPDMRLQTWAHAGIRHIHQIMQSQEILPFTDIQTKWELPTNAIFTYLQLKGIINTHVNKQQQSPEQSPLPSKA
ncbi:Hypothetical predicted protein, partial [Pelobates cultripes]